MSTVPTAPLGDATVATSNNSLDRARVELVRGGRAHAMPCTDHHAVVSVVVIAVEPGRLSSQATRDALAQTRRVGQVIVVSPPREAAVMQQLHESCGHDGRVHVLEVPRAGLAPAATRARRRVRQAQYLRAALPFVTGEWVLACPDDTALPTDAIATALSRAQRETLEVVWTEDDATLADRGFAGVLWTTAYAALGLDDRPGWEGHAVDAAWWSRLAAAGVRVPGAAPLEAAVARRGR